MADQWSCTKFESGGKRYFVSIAHRSEGGGEGVADLALTDGELAWTAEGKLWCWLPIR